MQRKCTALYKNQMNMKMRSHKTNMKSFKKNKMLERQSKKKMNLFLKIKKKLNCIKEIS